jgi:hypothetical protein
MGLPERGGMIFTSEDFVHHARTVSQRQDVESWAWRYLAAGDAAYTSQGKSLADMFKGFGNDPQRLMADFEAWVAATLKEERATRDTCPACGASATGFCTLVTGGEHLHNGPGSECCQDAWHTEHIKWLTDNPCCCAGQAPSPRCPRHKHLI